MMLISSRYDCRFSALVHTWKSEEMPGMITGLLDTLRSCDIIAFASCWLEAVPQKVDR